jgi:hypothetical protein
MKTPSTLLSRAEFEALKRECEVYVDRARPDNSNYFEIALRVALLNEVLLKIHQRSFTPKKSYRITFTKAQAICLILCFGQRTGYSFEINTTNRLTAELGKHI